MTWNNPAAFELLVRVYEELDEQIPDGLVTWAKRQRPDLLAGIREAEALMTAAFQHTDYLLWRQSVDAIEAAWRALLEA